MCINACMYVRTCMRADVFAQLGAIKSENGSLFSSPGCNITVALVEDRSEVRSARKILLEQVMWL